MAVEIERKFLVRSEAWRSLANTEGSIRQAYLASGERSTTRVRIKNGTDATVTIKSKRAELRRLEIEYPISVLDAEEKYRCGQIELPATAHCRGTAFHGAVPTGGTASLGLTDMDAPP
jgi:CYTH domain-containing protein